MQRSLKHIKSLIAFLVCLFVSTSMLSQKSFDIEKLTVGFGTELNSYTEVFKTEALLTPESLEKLIEEKIVEKQETKSSYGMSSNYYYWCRFSVDWKEIGSKLLIELNNPHLDEVLLYEKGVNRYTKIGYGGDKNHSFRERVYENRRFIFPLEKRDKIVTYYLMIDKKNSSVSFPLFVWYKKDFEHKEERLSMFFGVYFGFMLFIAFISCLIGVVVWRKLFVYYSLYVLTVSGYIFTTLGYSFQYLYPDAVMFNNYARVLLILMMTSAGIIYVKELLYSKKVSLKLDVFLKIIACIYLLMIIVWLFDHEVYHRSLGVYVLYFIYLMSTLALIGFILLAVKCYKYNRLHSLLFFCSFSFIILSVFVFTANEIGWVQDKWFAVHPVVLGFGLEVLSLSIGMLFVLKRILNKKSELETKISETVISKSSLEEENETLKGQIETISKSRVFVQEDEKILLNSGVYLKFIDILYIKSDGNYLDFFTSEKERPEADRNTLKNIEKDLPSNFLRVHRSHIVNTNFIEKLETNSLLLQGNISIPVSKSYKLHLKAKLA